MKFFIGTKSLIIDGTYGFEKTLINPTGPKITKDDAFKHRKRFSSTEKQKLNLKNFQEVLFSTICFRKIVFDKWHGAEKL